MPTSYFAQHSDTETRESNINNISRLEGEGGERAAERGRAHFHVGRRRRRHGCAQRQRSFMPRYR